MIISIDHIKFVFLVSTFFLFFFLPFNTAIDDIALGFILLCSTYLIYKQSEPLKIDTLTVSIISFGIILYLSSIFANSSFQILKEHRDVLKIISLFLVYKNITLNKNEIIAYILLPLMFSSIALLCLGVYKFYFLHDYSRFHLFTNINRSSIYALLSITLLLPFSFEFTRYRSLMFFSLIIILTTIFLLGSRTAIVLAFVIVLFYLFLLNRSIPLKISLTFLSLIFISILIVFFFNNDLLSHKFSNITYEPYRPKIWQAGIDTYIISQKWFFGIGTGQFHTIDLTPYNIPNFSQYIGSAHNLFLEILVENGLIGLITYFLFLFLFFKKLLSIKNKLFFQIGILTFLAHIGTSMTETTLMQAHGILLLIIFALCTNTSFLVSQKEHIC